MRLVGAALVAAGVLALLGRFRRPGARLLAYENIPRSPYVPVTLDGYPMPTNADVFRAWDGADAYPYWNPN